MGGDRPLAVLVARRPPGAPSFGRRETSLAAVLMAQAQSWLSAADLVASRDAAMARVSAADEAARALGDLGAGVAPALGLLRDSASRLARLAASGGVGVVGDIVEELYAVERAVASLLGAVALAAEPELAAIDAGASPPGPSLATSAPGAAEGWTTTGVLPEVPAYSPR